MKIEHTQCAGLDVPKKAVELPDKMSGLARHNSEAIVSEIGIVMNRFPTADHLASWAVVASGNNKSERKHLSGARRKDNCSLVMGWYSRLRPLHTRIPASPHYSTRSQPAK